MFHGRVRTLLLAAAAIGATWLLSSAAKADPFRKTNESSSGGIFDSVWVSPMVAYGVGYSQVGQEYNSSGTLLQGPVAGVEFDFQKDAFSFGADFRIPVVFGLANTAVLPCLGFVIAYEVSPKFRVSLGFGIEKLAMKSPTVMTPEGAPIRIGAGYRLASGNFLLAEIAYRQYSFDNGVVTSAFPYSSFQVGMSFPLNLYTREKPKSRF